MGAPDSTAAAVVSPGSLPSMTLAGTGEKFLVKSARLPSFLTDCVLRGAVVDSNQSGCSLLMAALGFAGTCPSSRLMPDKGIGGRAVATGVVLSHRVKAGVLLDRLCRTVVRSVLAAALCIEAMLGRQLVVLLGCFTVVHAQ